MRTKRISLNTNSNIHHKLSWLVSEGRPASRLCWPKVWFSYPKHHGHWLNVFQKAFHAPFYARPVTPLNLLHFFCPTAFSILRTRFPPMIPYQQSICLSFTPSNFHMAHLLWKCTRFTFYVSSEPWLFRVLRMSKKDTRPIKLWGKPKKKWSRLVYLHSS